MGGWQLATPSHFHRRVSVVTEGLVGLVNAFPIKSSSGIANRVIDHSDHALASLSRHLAPVVPPVPGSLPATGCRWISPLKPIKLVQAREARHDLAEATSRLRFHHLHFHVFILDPMAMWRVGMTINIRHRKPTPEMIPPFQKRMRLPSLEVLQ